MISASVLVCPVCGGELKREGASLLCHGGERRHTYDVAREGYVNLLPPGRGRNSRSGDEAAMIRARSAFLSTGAYDAIPIAVAELICEGVTPSDGGITVLDSGCGEGYHSIKIAERCAELSGAAVDMYAFDASKVGTAHGARAAAAAGLSPRGGVGCDFDSAARVSFVTGNIFTLPVRDASADAVVSMFAPLAWEEMSRVLKPGGIVVVAASGENHLYELRRILYDKVITKKPSVVAPDAFTETARRTVEYDITLTDNATVMSLFGMTPFCYNAPREGAAALERVGELDVTVEAELFVFRKN